MNQDEVVRVPASAGTRASNAIVAVTDFYSRELANREAMIAQQGQVIEQLGAQLRMAEARARDEETAAKTYEARLKLNAEKRKLPRGSRRVLRAVRAWFEAGRVDPDNDASLSKEERKLLKAYLRLGIIDP